VSDFSSTRLRYLKSVWFVAVLIGRRVGGYRGLEVDTMLGHEIPEERFGTTLFGVSSSPG